MAHHLIQLLLPVADNHGQAYPESILQGVKAALVEKYGGVTAFEMSPAQGVWAPDGDRQHHDQVVTIEVMVDAVDEDWWRSFRKRLERELEQEEIVVRAFPIRKL